MNRPKLKIKKEPVDFLAEFLAYVAVIISFALPLLYFEELPEELPIHFNASGAADRLGPRNSIWILPALGLALCLGINRLTKFPHLFNYPVKISEKNALHYYRISQRSLRWINLIITASIAYITYRIIFTSLGESEGLRREFLIIFTFLMLGSPLFFLLKMRWLKRKE